MGVFRDARNGFMSILGRIRRKKGAGEPEERRPLTETEKQTIHGRLFTLDERRRILNRRNELVKSVELGKILHSEATRLLANEMHFNIGEKQSRGEAITAPRDHDLLEEARKLLMRKERAQNIQTIRVDEEEKARRSIWTILDLGPIESLINLPAEILVKQVTLGEIAAEDAPGKLFKILELRLRHGELKGLSDELKGLSEYQLKELHDFLRDFILRKAEAMRRRPAAEEAGGTRGIEPPSRPPPRREPGPPEEGGRGPTSGGGGLPPGPPAGGPRGGSYYEDNIKSVEAAKRAFFEGDKERAIEILKDIGWDNAKIRKALEKWENEYKIVEEAERLYYNGKPREAAKTLKKLGWNDEKIRKALLRWERQYRPGRTMVTEEREAQRTQDGKIDFFAEHQRLKEHIERMGVQTSFMPKEASKKFFAKSSPSGKVVMDYLEELWEVTIGKS